MTYIGFIDVNTTVKQHITTFTNTTIDLLLRTLRASAEKYRNSSSKPWFAGRATTILPTKAGGLTYRVSVRLNFLSILGSIYYSSNSFENGF